MNFAVNAWTEIDRWLRFRHCTQSDLAAHLGITASAVTQIKKGINLLSAEQLRSVFEYLEIDENTAEEICCTIFRARLGSALPHRDLNLRTAGENAPRNPWPMESSGSDLRSVPQISSSTFRWYEPALERAEEFVCRNAEGMAQIAGPGDFLLTGLPYEPGSLSLAYSRPVRSGDVIFVKLRDGRMLSGTFRCRQGRAELDLGEPFCRTLRYQRGVDVNFFFWAFPVCDAAARLPAASLPVSRKS